MMRGKKQKMPKCRSGSESEHRPWYWWGSRSGSRSGYWSESESGFWSRSGTWGRYSSSLERKVNNNKSRISVRI